MNKDSNMDLTLKTRVQLTIALTMLYVAAWCQVAINSKKTGELKKLEERVRFLEKDVKDLKYALTVQHKLLMSTKNKD